MAMSVGEGGGEDMPMSDINTTPLVDVMLVLLIIFLITIPVVIQSVKVELPKIRYEPTQTKAENVLLTVRGGPGGVCQVYWQTTPVTHEELLKKAVDKLKREIDKQGGPTAPGLEIPEVHVKGDINTPYRCIGGTVFTMQMAGFIKVGFISQPEGGGDTVRL